MRRREFIATAVTAGAARITGRAAAQSAVGRLRVGVLVPVAGNDAYVQNLRAGLDAAGWTDQANLTLAVRHADGSMASFRRHGEELAALPVDVLVTASTAAAGALQSVTTTVPIVFVGTFDPVAAGLVATLARPGGNLTGIAGFRADTAAIWVRYLRAIAPKVASIEILYNAATIAPSALAGWRSAMAGVVTTGDLPIERADQIDGVIARVAAVPRAEVVVVPHTFPLANRDAVVAAMAKHRVPALYGVVEMVCAGGLIIYGQNLAAQWRMAASYVDRIARGTAAADLPVRFADRFDLAINRRAAGALGLAIPPDLAKAASELVG